jgi:hypothetical protein
MREETWKAYGILGHIEVVRTWDDGGACTVPICRVHEAGAECPSGAPEQTEAWRNAALICYAKNELPSLIRAAKECREALAAAFRGAEIAGGYATESLMDAINDVGIADGYVSRLQEAIRKADEAMR